jgi:formiminotetrahydrofolate cyclodeaminase
MEIMEKANEILEVVDQLEQKGSRMAVSDAGVAAQFARAALNGAVMNVYINTKSMKNREKAEELNAKARKLIEIGESQADAIYARVLEKLV